MSIVNSSNRWLNRLYKTVAILLVLFAVAISAFRLFLPYVYHYRLPLQNYLNEKAQTNISIGTLSMTWQEFGPSIVIGDVQVIDTEHASVFIKRLELQVDLWQSIKQQSLISKDLILSDANVDVDQQVLQVEKVDGTGKVTPMKTVANELDVFGDFLINRIKRFSIIDSQVTIRNNAATRRIRVNQLFWLNTGDRSQAQGSVVLNNLSSNNLQLKLDLRGKKSTELTGQVYLQANHIDITPWLNNVLVLDDDKTKTDINFSAWLNVHESNIKRLTIDFSDSDIHWFYDNKKQQLALEKGQLLLIKGEQESNFNLYSTPLILKLNEQPVQKITAVLAKKADEFTLHLSELDIAMFAQLTPLIVSNEATRKLISQMKLTGTVEDLYLRHHNNKLQATATFSNVYNNYSSGIPGLENVSGQLSLVDDYFAIDFKAEQGKLDFDKAFVQAFPYESLSGQLNVAFDEQGWALTVEQFNFFSKDIHLSTQLKIEAPIDGAVKLALLANISNGNAGLVGRYLPLPIMSENLVDYLNSAVISGRIEEGQVLFNGPIDHFPFTDGSGTFVVDVELSEAEFKFVQDWPAINDFVANLNFTNNSMSITGRGGQLTGLDVTGVRAGIVDLAQGQVLTVDADIPSTAVSNIVDLMNQSPLKESVGSTLEYLQLEGEVSGDFQLNLPLNDSDQTQASGSILFDNNLISLQAPQMNFSDVQGQLHFSNDKISTKDMQLIWQGLPVAVDIVGGDRSEYYHTDIKLSALWQESQWLAYVPKELQRYTRGEFPWQGELSLYQHHQGGFSYKAAFDSDLTKTQLLLPAPYGRSLTEKNSLSVRVNGEGDHSTVVLDYGNKMHFSGLFNHQTTAFSRANLTLGESAMALPNDGFHITTKLDYADFAQWQPLITNIVDSISQPSMSKVDEKPASTQFLPRPKRIRGSIDQMEILGQSLNNVSFNLIDKEQWWLLQFDAKETRSQIKIYPDWLTQGLDINAEFLNIPSTVKEKNSEVAIPSKLPDPAENDIVFANIPPLNFHCDSCSIGLLNLGEVDVKIERVDAETIAFSHFKATRDNAQLTFNGRWLHNEQNSNTRLTGKLLVDDIETELKAYGFDSIIKDSGIQSNFNLNWSGGLHDFDISQLNGTYNARVDDGYLADVSDKARIFSVLSLQSLVRKLTLDFRDIFSDGMFYSSIRGDYQLKQGVLTTHNTEMNGNAGDLFMTGHTNLVTGELDYDMSYKPKLSSSLPVLAWIATLDPVTFLAGVAIDQVIKSQVVSEFNFKLTGSVDNPDFREVDRKSKSVSVDTKLVTEDAKQEQASDNNKPEKPVGKETSNE
ncbi:MAG: YhdP family protein [Colwellia sp.]